MQPIPIRVTLKEIAKKAGVNVSTVSRALAGSYGVRQDTREKVLEVARKFNYRPNLIARGLVTGHSHSIGLLISDIRNPFFAEVARGAEDAAFPASYDLILCNSDLNQAKQMRYIRSLLDKNVSGVIIHSVTGLSVDEREELAACGIPIVLLDRPTTKHPFSTVSADNHQGGMLAGQHLIDLGHRFIGHLTGPRDHSSFADRAKGFLEAVQSSSFKATPTIVYGDHSCNGGYEMTKTLLTQQPEITAIFAANDAIALGVLKAATECGVPVPERISVVGFDDIEICSLIQPSLTTVHQPTYEMGQAAAEILLKQARKKETRVPEHRQFGVTLIQRNSCLAPSGAADRFNSRLVSSR